MYFIKYGDKYIYDPRYEQYKVSDTSFTGSENNIGYFDFTMYPDHPLFGKLVEKDAHNLITVYESECENKPIFQGYITEIEKDFYLSQDIKCTGELGFLTESIIRPYSTLDTSASGKYKATRLRAPSTIDGYFEWLIEQHNSQVIPEKQFKVGINEGALLSSTNNIYRASSSYPDTWDEINDKILSSDALGGYVRVRWSNGVRYIDLLYEWTDENTQVIEFGKNLLDYTCTDNSDDLATCIIPTGANMSETEYDPITPDNPDGVYNLGYYITSDTTMDTTKTYYTWDSENKSFSSVGDDVTAFVSGTTYYEYNDDMDESTLPLTISGLQNGVISGSYIKQDDYIYNEEAIIKYGMITTTVSNTDITTREYLRSWGAIKLASLIYPARTISISAIDLHMLNDKLKPISIGEYVRIKSKPHSIDNYYICSSIDLDLLKPEQSKYTFGIGYDTLTGQQSDRATYLDSKINTTYEAATAISIEAKNKADGATASVKEAKENITTATEDLKTNTDTKIESLASSVTETYATKTEVNAVDTKVESNTSQINGLITDTSNITESVHTMNETLSKVETVANSASEVTKQVQSYMNFNNGTLEIGKSDSKFKMNLTEEELAFYSDQNRVSWFGAMQMYITNGVFVNSIRLGNLIFTKRSNGSIGVKKAEVNTNE